MLIKADARYIPLAAGSVACVVTSPPYWGLRDYGTAAQLGQESTPEAYVSNLVEVCRGLWRVLRDDGTLWLNLGDSYGGNGPSKQLMGMPWRVAFALQADGWYLRSDIIWSKPNPMPESVTDRPTKAHEYLFLLTKSARYYYDASAIAEATDDLFTQPRAFRKGDPKATLRNDDGAMYQPRGTRNKRSVWAITSQAYLGAHFATMPEALIEPCILAGCPLGGRVLDPFVGSGTVGAVAERLSRRWVGLDLAYQNLAAERTAQIGLPFA